MVIMYFKFYNCFSHMRFLVPVLILSSLDSQCYILNGNNYSISVQKLPGQAQCDQCPAGFYCNATFGPVVTYDPYVCPEGFYCPNGTQYAEEYPCPVSTFNNITGK